MRRPVSLALSAVIGETDSFTDWELTSSSIISYGHTCCLTSARQHTQLLGTIISSSSHQKEKVTRFPKAQEKTPLLTWAFTQSHKSALEEVGTIDGHNFKLLITLWIITSSCVSTEPSRLKTSLLQGSISPGMCSPTVTTSGKVCFRAAGSSSTRWCCWKIVFKF